MDGIYRVVDPLERLLQVSRFLAPDVGEFLLLPRETEQEVTDVGKLFGDVISNHQNCAKDEDKENHGENHEPPLGKGAIMRICVPSQATPGRRPPPPPTPRGAAVPGTGDTTAPAGH